MSAPAPVPAKLQLVTHIAAPPARVADRMLADATYRDWTSAFMAGSFYEGSWAEGSRIRFLAPDGSGMVGEIAEHRPAARVSIRLLGLVHGGVDDTDSPEVRAWAPAYETYTFTPEAGGTRLTIDQDTTEAMVPAMRAAWEAGLARLKALCEAG